MNTAHSNWTGRARRTMTEAFGPNTPNQLEPMPEAALQHALAVAATNISNTEKEKDSTCSTD